MILSCSFVSHHFSQPQLHIKLDVSINILYQILTQKKYYDDLNMCILNN
jgi:hypothetical protein